MLGVILGYERPEYRTPTAGTCCSSSRIGRISGVKLRSDFKEVADLAPVEPPIASKRPIPTGQIPFGNDCYSINPAR